MRNYLSLLFFVSLSGAVGAPITEWTMVNVDKGDLQADAHWLKLPDGTSIFIDVGDTQETLVPFVNKHQIKVIDKVIISHPHKDHYAGLFSLLDAKIKIKEVYLNLPDRPICAHEEGWGCDYADLERLVRRAKLESIKLSPVAAGDVFYRSADTKLETLFAYDGIHTPVSKTDINDMSLILRLTHGNNRVLFTGDLNQKLGAYLAGRKEVKADILKVPHHGTEGVAPDSFFDAVGAKLALIPSPRKLWLSERSKRVRTYFQQKQIPYYVSGLNGDVVVTLHQKGFTVASEIPLGGPSLH